MSIITYKFCEGGVIPGVPRELYGGGYNGLEVDIDSETNEVLDVRHPKAIKADSDVVKKVQPEIYDLSVKEPSNTSLQLSLDNKSIAKIEGEH